jgi:hypothetical protein
MFFVISFDEYVQFEPVDDFDDYEEYIECPQHIKPRLVPKYP